MNQIEITPCGADGLLVSITTAEYEVVLYPMTWEQFERLRAALEHDPGKAPEA